MMLERKLQCKLFRRELPDFISVHSFLGLRLGLEANYAHDFFLKEDLRLGFQVI